MHTTMRRLERAILVCLLLLAAFVIWQSAAMPAGTIALPGPGMVPLAIGILLALTVIGIFLTKGGSPDELDAPMLLGNRAILASAFAVLIVGVVFEAIGFLAASTLFLFAMLWMHSKIGWWRSMLAAFITAAIAGYIFDNLLGVILPPFPWTS